MIVLLTIHAWVLDILNWVADHLPQGSDWLQEKLGALIIREAERGLRIVAKEQVKLSMSLRREIALFGAKVLNEPRKAPISSPNMPSDRL